MGIDIDEVRRWFGDGWKIDPKEPWTAARSGTRIGLSPHGQFCYGRAMGGGGMFIEHEARTLSVLAARVRKQALQEARAIRVEWVEIGAVEEVGCHFTTAIADTTQGGGTRFEIFPGTDIVHGMTTEQANALRDWLDDRLAMVPPGGDE